MSPGRIRLARWVERLPLCRVIWADDGTPYLLRIYLVRIWRRRLPGIFLHYFYQGDHARALHSHPWKAAASIILTGGYVEHRRQPDGSIREQTFRPGDLNVLTADTFHRVDLLKTGCWTLFLVGRRAHDWGFSERPGEYEPHAERERRIERERQATKAA